MDRATRTGHLLEVARGTMTAAEYCFLITPGASGGAHARLMQHFGPEEDLRVLFGTSPRSRKAREISEGGWVLVAFENPAEPAYVTLTGTARIEDDVEERRGHWRESWTDFFPAGPAGDDYVLIEFTPTRIELMDFARDVAPAPFGLRPAVLRRTGEAWEVEDNGYGVDEGDTGKRGECG